MRQIVLDTETTGLNHEHGHRIIEIGCVEIINRQITGNQFHYYLNPDREIDAGAMAVHGLSQAFLSDKPRFHEICDSLTAFIANAELIIHNAPFDIGFLENEYTQIGQQDFKISDICKVFDTLVFARQLHPGQRNSLDALCKRYQIDNSHRNLHGALLDADILARVYLHITAGQSTLFGDDSATKINHKTTKKETVLTTIQTTNVISATTEELKAHRDFLEFIQTSSGKTALWNQLEEPLVEEVTTSEE